jgi:hypothetical protein
MFLEMGLSVSFVIDLLCFYSEKDLIFIENGVMGFFLVLIYCALAVIEM